MPLRTLEEARTEQKRLIRTLAPFWDLLDLQRLGLSELSLGNDLMPSMEVPQFCIAHRGRVDMPVKDLPHPGMNPV